MGRNIAVVGAGQGGLVLALGLLQRGHRVTLFAERPPAAVRIGPATGSSALMGRSIQIERDLGLNLWDDVAEPITGLLLHLFPPPPVPPLSILGHLTLPGSAVDQRLKFATWLDLFADRGGRLVVGPVSPTELDAIHADHDLVVVAAGRGPLSGLFERDPDKSVFDRPQRALAQFYVTGVRQAEAASTGTGHLRVLPGLGEFMTLPFHVADGYHCHVILIEAVPGGPLDRFPAGAPVVDALAVMKATIKELLPESYDVVADAEPAGDNSLLRGAITPEVRQPVGYTPAGRPVAGLGDAVIVNDPIAGQGANSATRWAYDLLDHIDATTSPLDEAWMRSVFDAVWTQAQHLTRLSNTLLAEPPEHLFAIFGAASQHPGVAADIVHGFEDPATLDPWLYQPADAMAYLAHRVGAANGS